MRKGGLALLECCHCIRYLGFKNLLTVTPSFHQSGEELRCATFSYICNSAHSLFRNERTAYFRSSLNVTMSNAYLGSTCWKIANCGRVTMGVFDPGLWDAPQWRYIRMGRRNEGPIRHQGRPVGWFRRRKSYQEQNEVSKSITTSVCVASNWQ